MAIFVYIKICSGDLCFFFLLYLVAFQPFWARITQDFWDNFAAPTQKVIRP